MIYYDPKHETMPREEIELFQFERLQALLARLKRNVRRYRELLGDLRVASLGDLPRLPTTTPEDLVAGIPYGLLALPLREVVRLQSAVGPDGKQLVIGFTQNDLRQWARLVARQLTAAGVTGNEVVQIRFGGGVFEKSLGYLLGAEQIQASVIPEDPFYIEYQLAMLQNYRATALITTPANALDLIHAMNERQIDPQSLHLRTVLLSRPITREERQVLQTGLFSVVQCNFGVPEILDPGLCVECKEGRFHLNEDQFLAEIVDGELLITTLCREAMPLLRYHTRIACELSREKCPCGRTGVALHPTGRKDDRMLINEVPLYPAQIRQVLAGTVAPGQRFHLTITDRHITVQLEVTNAYSLDSMRPLVDLRNRIQSEMFARFGIDATIQYVERCPPDNAFVTPVAPPNP